VAGERANDCEAHIHQAHHRSAMRCIWLRRSISVRLPCPALPETVVARPTYSRGPAEPVHDCPGFGRLLDLLIESVPPLTRLAEDVP
jgi:hypothetical protein